MPVTVQIDPADAQEVCRKLYMDFYLKGKEAPRFGTTPRWEALTPETHASFTDAFVLAVTRLMNASGLSVKLGQIPSGGEVLRYQYSMWKEHQDAVATKGLTTFGFHTPIYVPPGNPLPMKIDPVIKTAYDKMFTASKLPYCMGCGVHNGEIHEPWCGKIGAADALPVDGHIVTLTCTKIEADKPVVVNADRGHMQDGNKLSAVCRWCGLALAGVSPSEACPKRPLL